MVREKENDYKYKYRKKVERENDTGERIWYLVEIYKSAVFDRIYCEKTIFPYKGHGNCYSHYIFLRREEGENYVRATTWCKMDGYNIHSKKYGIEVHFLGILLYCSPSIFGKVEKKIDTKGDEVAKEIFYWLSRLVEYEYDPHKKEGRGRICWKA